MERVVWCLRGGGREGRRTDSRTGWRLGTQNDAHRRGWRALVWASLASLLTQHRQLFRPGLQGSLYARRLPKRVSLLLCAVLCLQLPPLGALQIRHDLVSAQL